MIETTDLAPARASADAATTGAAQLSSLLAVEITPDRVEWANATAKQVRAYRKALEDEEKSGTKPLLAVVDKIRGWFRDPKAVCDQVYTHLTKGVERCIEEGRREQMRLAAAAAATGAGHAEIQRAVEAAVQKPTGSKTVTYYSARVTDASKVPAQFWMINQQALDAHARAVKDAFNVPGVELVRDTRVVPL
ncbi:MAG: hypothetical protein IPH07_24255 [Deltaproteobacteria bacterium]|nr:hypothetical protein [Deltaproteobacteria bacterium]